MLQESDNVQALATAYGENMAIEQFAKAIQSAKAELRPVLQNLFSLYALDRIMADGVFFLQNGFISAKQSELASIEIRRLCHELGNNMLDLTAGFGIPDHVNIFCFFQISNKLFYRYFNLSYTMHRLQTIGLNIILLKITVNLTIKIIKPNRNYKNIIKWT